MATAQPGMEPTILERLGDKFNAFVEGCIRLLSRLMGGESDVRRIKSLGYFQEGVALLGGQGAGEATP